MLVATALAGGIAIAIAWFGASGSAAVTQQVGWLNLGIGGFVVFAGGNCLWLLRVRRAVGARRAALISLEPDEPDPVSAPAVPVMDATVSWGLVRGAGMRKLHYPDCPLVVGKHLEPAALAEGELCGVCTELEAAA